MNTSKDQEQTMTHHVFSPFEVKDLSSTGVFFGYASVFNTVDYQGDCMMNTAFDTTLSQWEKKGVWPKMLLHHNPSNIIGRWLNMSVDQKGLLVEGQIMTDLPKGYEAYTLLKHGLIEDLSIGYQVKNAYTDSKTGHRLIHAVDLFEVSLVTFGANPFAQVVQVKKQGMQDHILLVTQIERIIHKLSMHTHFN